MSPPEPLEIEGLLTADERRVTLDELEADPILDRLPAYRSEDDKSRLDAILDELDGRLA